MRYALPLCLILMAVSARSAEEWPGEPTVNRKEAALIEQAVGLAQTNLLEAARLLREETPEDASPALDYALGTLNRQLNDLTSAATSFREALRKEPGFQRAREQLAFVECLRGFPDVAVRLLQALEAAGVPSSQGWTLVGQTQQEKRRLTAAEQAYRRAVGLDSNNPQALYGLASTFLAQERYQMALSVLEEATDLTPLNKALWSLRANCLIALDRHDEAQLALETARRLNILGREELKLLGDLYFNEGSPDEAMDVYTEAFKLGIADAGEVLRVAQAFAAANRLPQARRLLNMLAADPSNLSKDQRRKVKRLQAEVDYHDGKRDQARQALGVLVREDPLDGEALLQLAAWDREAGDLDRAEALYQQASRLDGTTAQANDGLANIAIEQQNYPLALRYLENAQLLTPTAEREKLLESVTRLVRLVSANR